VMDAHIDGVPRHFASRSSEFPIYSQSEVSPCAFPRQPGAFPPVSSPAKLALVAVSRRGVGRAGMKDRVAADVTSIGPEFLQICSQNKTTSAEAHLRTKLREMDPHSKMIRGFSRPHGEGDSTTRRGKFSAQMGVRVTDGRRGLNPAEDSLFSIDRGVFFFPLRAEQAPARSPPTRRANRRERDRRPVHDSA